ncbi:1-acyl-sn-glycerol-3-phosphate acyltransferase [Lactobacillus sp. ESL0681]|uniref:lysophospholipid acyltransferase family protein n=1 Tax=Lactobacillus sp. ESL0681 TaxID=2983211 RepID=UPI0023F76109|nr:1-acyl-sn-glycerol-3-phosphate acyltransferase [Lactobacillus sp. ESL0681]WEV39747.1 1-acyl-sn-glycerol-3-phosphate acyltransferase [Lactobacillus sp. ESL0681]
MVKHQYYYHDLSDDLVTTKDQDYHLASNYTILPTSAGHRFWSTIIKRVAHLASIIYNRVIVRVHIIGKEKLAAAHGQGYFIYGNHTQAFGDAILPLSFLPANNYYAICAQANWSIPILGKLVVPYFGLPVGYNLQESGKLVKAVKKVIKASKTVVIYPEAHVWPYYTKIRPFSATSMHFPIALNVPSFVMTTTYHRPKRGKQPQIIVYLDGPFYPDNNLNKKQAQNKLHKQIYTMMQKRAALSDYQYCTYTKKD